MGGLRRLKRKSVGAYDVGPLRNGLAPAPWKLSTVILDFAKPLLDRFPDDRDYETAVELAITCWNLALFPDAERTSEMRSLLKRVARGPADSAEEIQEWIKILVNRKKTLFAHDRRMVMGHTVVREGASRTLYVTSTPVHR